MAIKQVYISHSSRQTKKLGAILGGSLNGRALICLSGDLGGGKTVFAQGLASGLGVSENITSPSFVLMKKYRICHCEEAYGQISRYRSGQAPQSHHKAQINYFYHLDCYRLKKAEEILAIGLEEILADQAGVILVEWAERITKYLPQERINIEFEFIDKNKRKIIISN